MTANSTPYTFPTAIGRTAWADIEHYAGTYLTYFYATDRSRKIVRSLTRIAPLADTGKTVRKTLVLYHNWKVFHYEGYLFPAPNNNFLILLEKPGQAPAEVYLSFFKHDTCFPSEEPDPHFVALSCNESFRIGDAHFPTAYRELFIRYEGEIGKQFLGMFAPDKLGSLDPDNPRLDRFYLNKLRQDFFTDDPFLQIFPPEEETRLGRGKHGYGSAVFDREIELLVKIGGLPDHRLRLVMDQISSIRETMKRQGIPGDIRILRRNLDPFLLTVSIAYSHRGPDTAERLCRLLKEELQSIERQYRCDAHEISLACRLAEQLPLFAPCATKTVLQLADFRFKEPPDDTQLKRGIERPEVTGDSHES